MNKVNKLVLLIILTLTGFNNHAKTELQNKLIISEKITKYFSDLNSAGYSGAILVDIGGEKIISKGLGFSDRKLKIQNSADTVFDIGSITKQFTAAAILKLQMQSKLSVNDKITKYFSNVPKDKSNITLHHLLTHSSGLPGSVGDDYESIGQSHFMKKVFKNQLFFKPGSNYEYSNVGYSLLSIIIEKTSGQSYESYLYDNLWKPAGMETTGYSRPDFDSLAVGYLRGQAWGKPNQKNWDKDAPYLNLKGNGGILSTVEDMYKWHKVLLSEQVLSSESIRAYYKRHIKEGEDAPSFYGYGWAIFPTPRGTDLITHNGGNGIFFADFWRYLSEDITIVAMSNQSDRASRMVGPQIAQIILNPDYEATITEEVELDQDSVDHFIELIFDSIVNGTEKDWKQLIESHAGSDFKSMAPMKLHMEIFNKFKVKIKNGKINGVSKNEDELVVQIVAPQANNNLIINFELDKDESIKFTGLMIEDNPAEN